MAPWWDARWLYILHLDLKVHDPADPDPAKWMSIQPSGSLFEALRQIAQAISGFG